MSIDKPTSNKMMGTPPAKKGFHFAGDGVHAAMFIEAETIEEAEELYHKDKKPVGGTEQSTAPAAAEPKEGVQ